MSGVVRHLMALCLVVLLAILVPFWIWGDRIDSIFSFKGSREWLESFGWWAWSAGVVLLVADVALPIPSTVVMSALGWLYGWFWGGVISVVGSVLSGCAAYGLSRYMGRSVAVRIAGEAGLNKAELWFKEGGGWLVAYSRWMPVFPEAVACLAGLGKMPWRRFLTALLCGSLPLGFAFAAIGQLGHESPLPAIVLSALLPVGMWWVARKWGGV
jgi:uncharacterized membrane protein YdjX (TVP38/TMEM64 family)